MEKMQTMGNLVKVIIAAAGAWITAKLGALAPVLGLLLLLMVMDYITGMAASVREGIQHPSDATKGLSSKRGLKGILKKLGYATVIVVAIAFDWLLLRMAVSMGMSLPVSTFFGLLTTVWFILNEILSIVENAGRLGAPVPGFLSKAIAALKHVVEEKGEEQTGAIPAAPDQKEEE